MVVGALAPDTRVKRCHPKISEPGQDVAMAVGYWRHSVATLADRSMMAVSLAASPAASAMANDDILTVREAGSKVV
jgi:hypothetical protein